MFCYVIVTFLEVEKQLKIVKLDHSFIENEAGLGVLFFRVSAFGFVRLNFENIGDNSIKHTFDTLFVYIIVSEQIYRLCLIICRKYCNGTTGLFFEKFRPILHYFS